jgi:uncharacterized SAM-binding protein YcdF (DUF218 family)
MGSSRLKYIFLTLWIFTLVWTSGLLWFITLIPSRPSQDTRPADAIIVLTGGPLRLDHGFQLLMEGRAQKMFVSGVDSGVTLPLLFSKKEYRPYYGHVPLSSITLGYKARSTSGNAEETAEWMASEGVHSIRLVTANYHIPRSVYELQQAAPNVVIIAEPVFPKYFDHNDWWQWGEGIRLVVTEYCKYVTSVIGHHLFSRT